MFGLSSFAGGHMLYLGWAMLFVKGLGGSVGQDQGQAPRAELQEAPLVQEGVPEAS